MTPTHPACREIEPELLALAAGEAGARAAERVQRHVAACGPCRDDLGRYRAIEGLLGALRAAPLAGDDPTLARAALASRLADLRRRLVSFGVFDSPIGPLLIACSELGVSLVRYLERPRVARVEGLLGEDAVEDRVATEAFHRDLLEYLEGRRARLDWPLDLGLARSAFQRRVLEATARLPYGAVTAYARIAREVGAPAGARAVAQALRANPLPIVIPCHRVIGSSGALTGYAGRRIALKQRLLAVEGVPSRGRRGGARVERDLMYARHLADAEYCLPTCGSLHARPLAELTLFGSRARAEAAGLAPCTACRPDLHPLPGR